MVVKTYGDSDRSDDVWRDGVGKPNGTGNEGDVVLTFAECRARQSSRAFHMSETWLVKHAVRYSTLESERETERDVEQCFKTQVTLLRCNQPNLSE